MIRLTLIIVYDNNRNKQEDKEMRDKFLKTIQENGLINKGDGIVIGVSGGPDSLSMLHLFSSIQEAYDLSLYAVHLNHGYRGAASDADAVFVKDICNAWKIPLFSFEINVEKCAQDLKTSFENAGRIERYKLFFKVMNAQNAQKIAVAQNRNDQAETVLMRLIRGSGIEGLMGIQYDRGDGVIRPLLDCTRVEIESYCEGHHLQARIDHTNNDTKYTRNKIRKDILTEMAILNPSVVDNLVRTSQLLKEENQLLKVVTEKKISEISHFVENQYTLDLEAFNECEVALKRRLLRTCIEILRGHLIDVTYDEIETIIQLAVNKRTNSKKMYHSLTFEISYDKLVIYLGKKESKTESVELQIQEMTREEYDNYTLLPNEVAIDKDKVRGSLKLEKRQAGDKFQPVGMFGQKKIKDYFIDLKIPRDDRDNVPIVKEEHEIVWVVGYRQDRRYIVEENTSTVLILQCMKLLTK